jgi:hypothetical protein
MTFTSPNVQLVVALNECVRKFMAVDDAFDMIDTLYGVRYRFRKVTPG